MVGMEDEVGELHVILFVQCPVDPICLLTLLLSLRSAKQEQDKHCAAWLVLKAWWVSNL